MGYWIFFVFAAIAGFLGQALIPVHKLAPHLVTAIFGTVLVTASMKKSKPHLSWIEAFRFGAAIGMGWIVGMSLL